MFATTCRKIKALLLIATLVLGEARRVQQDAHSQAGSGSGLQSALEATAETRWRGARSLVGRTPLRQSRPKPGMRGRHVVGMTEFPEGGEREVVGLTSGFSPPPATSTLPGAIALVAGTTIGAGILALPKATLEAGFAPSTAALLGAWAYMTASGVLIAEVNVNTLCALERKAVSISTMAQETLGPIGSRISSAAYLFIHYTVLVAYILQGGQLLLEFGANSPLAALPADTVGPLLYSGLLGAALLLSEPELVEKVNNVLFVGVLASFVGLVVLGSQQLDPTLLAHVDLPAVIPALPLCVLSLVHQNVIPTICYQLGCDLPKIRQAIVAGTAVPTLMFIAWNAVILGSVPFDAAATAAMSGATFDPLEVLRASGNAFGDTVRVFSLLAVTTSFVGFYYGLTDFFADALGFDKRICSDAPDGEDDDEVGAAVKRSPAQKAALCALTVVPPVGFALWDPSVFFAALDNAGTYGVLTLFGILPAMMAWAQRYADDDEPLSTFVPDALPGGKPVLAGMVAAASAVIGVETWERFVAMGLV